VTLPGAIIRKAYPEEEPHCKSVIDSARCAGQLFAAVTSPLFISLGGGRISAVFLPAGIFSLGASSLCLFVGAGASTEEGDMQVPGAVASAASPPLDPPSSPVPPTPRPPTRRGRQQGEYQPVGTPASVPSTAFDLEGGYVAPPAADVASGGTFNGNFESEEPAQ